MTAYHSDQGQFSILNNRIKSIYYILGTFILIP